MSAQRLRPWLLESVLSALFEVRLILKGLSLPVIFRYFSCSSGVLFIVCKSIYAAFVLAVRIWVPVPSFIVSENAVLIVMLSLLSGRAIADAFSCRLYCFLWICSLGWQTIF